jgi:hypothetical protein
MADAGNSGPGEETANPTFEIELQDGGTGEHGLPTEGAVGAAAAPSSPTAARRRAAPHLSVWSSHWFLQGPSVAGDAGKKEGKGVVHEAMVSGWDVDLGAEWAEPPRFKPRRFLACIPRRR